MIEKPNVRFHDGQILSEEPLNKAMVAVDDCVDAANDAATKANTAETAATSAQSSASSAAASSAAIQAALEEIKGSGDIPAATVTKVAEHTVELDTLGSKTSEISKEEIETNDESIDIEDNDGNNILHLDKNGLDAKNVRSNGKDVLTEHQDISGLATKDDVAKKQDNIDEVSSESTSDSGDYVEISSDDEKESYFRVDKNGTTSKDFFFLNKNGKKQSVKDSLSTFDTNFVFPKKIYAVSGKIMNIYYENIFLNDWRRFYRVYNRDYTNPSLDYFPLAAQTGISSLQLTVENQNHNKITNCSADIVCNSSTASGNIKILVIGDSKTDNPKKLAELLNLCEKDGYMNVELLGSQAKSTSDADGNIRQTKSEGYSGRNIIDVVSSATLNGKTNIFYDSSIAGSMKFNFSKGVNALGDSPDVLFLDHGANQSTKEWSDVKASYDAIISSVKSYNATNGKNVKIVICVQEFGGLVPTLSHDNGSSSKWAGLHGSTKVTDYLTAFEERESEGIFVSPQFLYVDPWNDYPKALAPISSRNGILDYVAIDNVHMGINLGNYNSSTTYKVGDVFVFDNTPFVVLKDGLVGVSPVDDKVNYAAADMRGVNSGYYHVADSYFCILKHLINI